MSFETETLAQLGVHWVVSVDLLCWSTEREGPALPSTHSVVDTLLTLLDFIFRITIQGRCCRYQRRLPMGNLPQVTLLGDDTARGLTQGLLIPKPSPEISCPPSQTLLPPAGCSDGLGVRTPEFQLHFWLVAGFGLLILPQRVTVKIKYDKA